MDVHTRRLKMVQIQDQENVHVVKGKSNIVPLKKQGLAVRGPLGDLTTNAQVPCDSSVGKVAVTTAEFEKKSSLSRRAKGYNHVQSKVDTGRATRPVPLSRPLRREESTASLAAKAWASKQADKENLGINIPKSIDTKKTARLAPLKENNVAKGTTSAKPILAVKPLLKESTSSLQKLKIDGNNLITNNSNKRQPSQEQTKDAISPDLDTTPKLPADIEDIDADDFNKLTLMTAYIKDIYRYLRELEDKFPIEKDYLKKHPDLTPKMRATLVDWMVEVNQQFMQTQETLQIAVAIVDRYLQVTTNVHRSRLQLIAAASMFLASKYEEIYPPDLHDFVLISADTYTKQELLQYEREIMSKMEFCLAKPPPLYFVRRFVKAAGGDAKKHNLAKYLVELGLVTYTMVRYKPSELAAAAVCLSLQLITKRNPENIWNKTLEYYSGYNYKYIEPIMRKIANIVPIAQTSKYYKSVYKKYLEVSNSKVACLPELKNVAVMYDIE